MTVLVTGASGEIGAAAAKLFAENGFAVAVNFHKNGEAAAEVVSSVIHAGGRAKAFQADVSDPASVPALVSSVEESLGPVDILVNNAGVSVSGLLQDMTDADYERVMGINVKGAFNTCRAVLPGMIRRKHGVIVNVSSMWGETGASCETLYSMSKAALIGFTKALAKEVGPSGIRVNCVSPGVVDTKMNAAYSEEDMEALRLDTPLCRIGRPEEIAESIFFLCSDKAAFITGQVLGVNGGFLI